MLLGSGYDYNAITSIAGFLPGFGMCFAYFGLIGILLFLIALIVMYVKSKNNFQKAIVLFIICAFCVLDCMFNIYALFFFAFYIAGKQFPAKGLVNNKDVEIYE